MYISPRRRRAENPVLAIPATSKPLRTALAQQGRIGDTETSHVSWAVVPRIEVTPLEQLSAPRQGPIRVQGNTNLPPEKPPGGSAAPTRSGLHPCIFDHFFVSPSRAPTVVTCNDGERLSRAGVWKFNYQTGWEAIVAEIIPLLLWIRQVSPERPEIYHHKIPLARTKRASQPSPGSEQSKREGGGAAPCRRGDSCDRGDLPYVEKPPRSPIRRVDGMVVGWLWDPERTRLPHAGKPAEVHTH
ncbi:hypothetical protein BDFG_07694 [Blastomyces dermatitidis ATCC 26199]|nr:hypothetical protein BDFG_07694 [Blastomyces dermatitidis ATCC 26199]